MVLVVLDGLGVNPSREKNAVALADTPNMDRLWEEYPHTSLDASEQPWACQMGRWATPRWATRIWARASSSTRS